MTVVAAVPRPTPFADLRVGDWMVRPRLHVLERDGEARRISPKAMAVLLALAERPGAVWTRDELVDRAWEEKFVSDEALATVLRELRRALGDEARAPRYVETIRKSGYRLIATVTAVVTATPPESPEPRGAEPSTPGLTVASSGGDAAGRWLESAPAASRPPVRHAFRRGPLLATGTTLVLVASAWGLYALRETPPAPPHSLAVLPLATFPIAGVSSTGEERLAAALTEMLTADLAQVCLAPVVPGIAVRSRGSAWGLDDAVELLGVDAVIEGSVLRSGDRVWVAVQLVDTRSGALLWSDTYERQLGDELLVLREVARDVAAECVSRVPPRPG